MIVQDICNTLEELAPLSYAEELDNVGLLVGDPNMNVSGVLITLDTLESVVDEAIKKKCNLILSFHPIIFSGLKSITPKDYVSKVVLKAIQNNIAIYSMHTALDNAQKGVNNKLCEVLGIMDSKVLIPKKNTIKKLSTYVPEENAEDLKKALYEAGAGSIGDYNNCSFSTTGSGEFIPGENAKPHLGSVHHEEVVEEVQIQLVLSFEHQSAVIKTLIENHPYETAAYELFSLDNTNPTIGIGRIGVLEKELTESELLDLVKEKLGTPCIKHSQFTNKKIKTVAVLGGSGAFGITSAIHSGADAYLTSDLKYHDYFKAENSLLLADIGHFESEQFTKTLLVEYLTKKIPNFAPSLSETITNPVKYY